MLNLLLLVSAGVVAFASTNIDDLFVLVAFLSEPDCLLRHVFVGQYSGIAAIIGSSLALSLAALVIPLPWVGFLGIFPIGIGVQKAMKSLRLRSHDGDPQVPDGARRSARTVLQITLVTMSNGADNIAVYTPLFAVQTMIEKGLTVGVFLIMTGLWCGIAAWLVRHPISARRFGAGHNLCSQRC